MYFSISFSATELSTMDCVIYIFTMINAILRITFYHSNEHSGFEVYFVVCDVNSLDRKDLVVQEKIPERTHRGFQI